MTIAITIGIAIDRKYFVNQKYIKIVDNITFRFIELIFRNSLFLRNLNEYSCRMDFQQQPPLNFNIFSFLYWSCVVEFLSDRMSVSTSASGSGTQPLPSAVTAQLRADKSETGWREHLFCMASNLALTFTVSS